MRRNGNTAQTWRRLSAIVVLSTMTLLGLPGTSSGGGPQPTINFLNPSSFSSAGGEIVVTDRKTTRPTPGTSTYRLSAWVTNAPPNSGVEFELLSAGVSLDTFDQINQVGNVTFEHRWNIPTTLPDGPYTLRATLFQGNESVASVDQDVTLLRLADRAEVLYPTTDPGSAFPGGGGFGTFHPLARSLPEEGDPDRPLPVGNVEQAHTGESEDGGGTASVRAFYTTSTPGSVPEWKACGTEGAPGAAPFPSGAANDGVRCTLAEAADQSKITAVAAVANSNPGGYDPTANGAGDVVRVLNSYAQVPVSFNIASGDGAKLNANGTTGAFPCHTITGSLTDQASREILGANIDVQAFGPTDKTWFDTGFDTEGPVKEADRNHHLTEPGYDCFGQNDRTGSPQSEHQIRGAPDLKHVESTDRETNDKGEWGFSFKIPGEQVTEERFTFHYTMFVDEADDGCHANDDLLTGSELFRAGSVGLGADPAAPVAPAVSAVDQCGPPPPPPPPILIDRLIDIDVSSTAVRKGRKVRFFGKIESKEDKCESIQVVQLKTRNRKGRKFKTIAVGRTDNFGNYEFRKVIISRTRQYRAVAPATDECKRTASAIVTVRRKRTSR